MDVEDLMVQKAFRMMFRQVSTSTVLPRNKALCVLYTLLDVVYKNGAAVICESLAATVVQFIFVMFVLPCFVVGFFSLYKPTNHFCRLILFIEPYL